MKLKFEIISKETVREKPELFENAFRIVNRDMLYPNLTKGMLLRDLKAANYLIAVNTKGEAVGYIRFKEKEQKKIVTSTTFRLPELKKQGIATRMTEALGKWAREKGFEVIWRPVQSHEMIRIAERHRKMAKQGKGPFSKIIVRRAEPGSQYRNVTMHLRRKRR